MPSSARVSIVTPSYNQAAYLEETLCSVLDQGYPDLEYLVVDGGSTDGSLEIIKRYADRLAWWVSEADRGQADAINKGFARATGKYVAWLNSDDAYLPGAIQAAVAALQGHPEAALVYGDMLAVDAAGQVTNTIRYGDWGLDDLMRFDILGQPAVFMRRDALQRAGGLDLRYHYMLDHHLWLRLAQEGRLRHVSAYWARARFHPAAKNVAQAAAFGQEAYRIVAWMATQPALAPRLELDSRRIWAGAYRFDARYLLDGGRPGASLRAYAKSFVQHPPTALAEGHRILYALFSPLRIGWLKRLYLRLRRFAKSLNGRFEE